MSNTIDWGKAAVNNTIDYGQGAIDNTINWGKSQTLSPSGETNITGTPSTPPFSNVNSFSFDGVDDTFLVPNTSSLRFNRLDAFSFSAWINVSATGNNVILSNQRAPSTNYRGYYFAVLSNNLVMIHRSTLSDRLIFNGATNLLSGWNHVVFTYDGTASTSSGQFYINGSADTTTGSGTLTGTTESTDTLYLGCRSNTDNFFNGKVDETAIFTTELSQSDVTAIYNNGEPQSLDAYSPFVWFRMGDNATWNGATWTMTSVGTDTRIARSINMVEANRTTDVPTASTFSNTKSIALDGVDDFVEVGYIAELNNGSAFTYSGWYKQTTLDQERFLMGFFVSAGNWFGLYTWSDGNMYIHFKDGGVNKYGVFDYSTLVTANAWFNIVIVFNGSNSTNADRLKCYINGTQATLSFVGTQPTNTPIGANNLTLGKMDSFTQTWLGGADELALWNTDKSANVSTIYNSGVPNDISSLSPLSWWRFEGSGTTAIDSGSGGNNGTLVNGVVRSTDVPT